MSTFPAWRYGPEGKAEVFQNEADVPKGWADHPSRAPDAAPVKKIVVEKVVEKPVGVDGSSFDHNGDGKPGGSKSPEPTDDLKDLRAEYRKLVGKKPFPAWDAAELRRRMAAHTPEIDESEF
jgi:hypothetical protein